MLVVGIDFKIQICRFTHLQVEHLRGDDSQRNLEALICVRLECALHEARRTAKLFSLSQRPEADVLTVFERNHHAVRLKLAQFPKPVFHWSVAGWIGDVARGVNCFVHVSGFVLAIQITLQTAKAANLDCVRLQTLERTLNARGIESRQPEHRQVSAAFFAKSAPLEEAPRVRVRFAGNSPHGSRAMQARLRLEQRVVQHRADAAPPELWVDVDP